MYDLRKKKPKPKTKHELIYKLSFWLEQEIFSMENSICLLVVPCGIAFMILCFANNRGFDEFEVVVGEVHCSGLNAPRPVPIL